MCHSIHLCAHHTSCAYSTSKILNRILLKFWIFSSSFFFYMRTYMWYWVFDPIISDIITALVNWEIAIFLKLMSTTPPTSLVGFFRNFACFHIIIWRFAYGFELFSLFHSKSLMRLYEPKLHIMAHTLTSYRFIHCSLKKHLLFYIWHSAFIYQNTTIICLLEYVFLLNIISWKPVLYCHN